MGSSQILLPKLIPLQIKEFFGLSKALTPSLWRKESQVEETGWGFKYFGSLEASWGYVSIRVMWVVDRGEGVIWR